MGQLAKQLADRSSNNFSANTEKNPKEECKAVLTRSRLATQVKEGKAEKMVEGHKQQPVGEPTLEPVSDVVELEDVMEEEKEKSIKEIKMKEEEKNQKKEKRRKSKSERKLDLHWISPESPHLSS